MVAILIASSDLVDVMNVLHATSALAQTVDHYSDPYEGFPAEPFDVDNPIIDWRLKRLICSVKPRFMA